ncbi:hypothetical protein EW026_g479 [Hermanssonia centrifuga]|uniref:Acyl-coenzyme A oxidase N-terminal domain-containing protein n=1 Tax=Hermanssonia centrifuga TaxID=98765 RepID=A0A4V3XBJ9_9APHY|nr:hypothetical protein EW026_g479 [Hermanssonia centrifuga]
MVMALDMRRARSQMDVDVAIVRDFLYGNREKWEEHSELVKIMCEDPTFDKSQRLYMSRSGRYNNGLRMMNRIHELQDEYGWSSHQMTKAASLMDEPTGFHLHLVAFEPVMRSQASPKLLARYEALVRNRGILGLSLLMAQT